MCVCAHARFVIWEESNTIQRVREKGREGKGRETALENNIIIIILTATMKKIVALVSEKNEWEERKEKERNEWEDV